ncbi:MAG: alpha/beta fold hydrolase [Sphingopyxis sp.]
MLAYRVMGQGRPILLLHGLFSTAHVNWIKYGHAAALVAAGFRVIMPDLRAHGDSAHPHDAACYPDDVLAQDVADLVDHLALDDYDLGGFSLGSRTSVRAVVGGLAPARLILGGMGLEGLAGWSRRAEFFQRAIAGFDTAQRGDDIWMAVQFMKSMNVDRQAAALLLGTFADTPPPALAAITMPVLVVCGAQDQDNGSAEKLVAALPTAQLATIPGTHMSCVTEPALGQAMVSFLAGAPLGAGRAAG